jgi:type VI secretion system protein ImpH
LRLGPLPYARFAEFLPSRSPNSAGKAFFLLSQLARLYIGPELDFDVQLVLKKEDVPQCQLKRGMGCPQLGWNTWVRNREFAHDASDAVFKGDDSTYVEAK